MTEGPAASPEMLRYFSEHLPQFVFWPEHSVHATQQCQNLPETNIHLLFRLIV